MNESAKCVICQRETQRMACDRCQARMNSQLADLVTFMALASDNLLPGRGGDGRSTERTLGINVGALDVSAGFDAIAILESWERIWREDFGLSPYGPASAARNAHLQATLQPQSATLTGIVRFLQAWLERACDEHPAVDDFAAEVRSIHRTYKHAAGEASRGGWRVTCPADTDDGECANVLLVTAADFDSQVTCRRCRTTWATERLLRVVASSRHAELWLDPEAASEWLGVHQRTLRAWAKEGRIKRSHGRYEVHSLKALVIA
jgi:hypothetical protein